MKLVWLRGLALSACMLLAACAHREESAAELAAPITILVSIDGFRPDYLERGETPTLSRLAETGVLAEVRSSFPSLTFPNHYSLVTGLRPDRHGVVNNRMEDPLRPGVVFTLSDRVVGADPIWWEGGTPIWITAERQGVRSATMFWPGSDYELQGMRPYRWRAFDQSLPDFARVDVLLAWLDEPEPASFYTLYFDIVDTAGHRNGPDAPETTSAAAQVDAALARLLAGLAARGLERRVNFVIVADHGMAEVADDRFIELDAVVSAEMARVVWDGPLAGVEPTPGREAEVEQALLGAHPHGECWRKSEIPERFHFGTHRRIPAIVCLAEIGWRYRSAQMRAYPGQTRGAHGYDPAAPEMAALFIAHGPAFQQGVRLDTFDNVSIYPLIAHLIGVEPEENDGVLSDTARALASPP
jgi:predicted AlkP superfamily pyrophosphatase or phosphodiesterase